MPIGGGVFTIQNKVLPGAYINFVALGTRIVTGSRGVAALPVALNWGPDSKIITIDAGDFNKQSMALFGYDPTAPELLLIREAFKRAKTLKLYRINGAGGSAAKATKTIGGITVTAKYNGTRGNDIKILIQTNVDDETKKDVITYLGTVEVDRQTVVNASELVANDYVTFGSGTLTNAAATALTGGANGTEDGSAHADFLSKIEVEEFNTIGYPGSDATTKGLYEAFVKRFVTAKERRSSVCFTISLPTMKA
ncbi:phage tail sheath N-terminal beta-sandwich domain-containing protein [Acetivibrio straminisolvens]|uniref:Phage-like element PBSX protein XkdK n=1 Tax=Acetivibrio straminisolvens JCM 21531 TaxID=1294263 RepID=W4V8J5_9FIRM|nr:phage tail sheath N-terminal beta-sandwich domain-containing protein [Acetivibrio straminisolvens]GAE89527.1 phage-like element PBSX protein XkdK [Acetivibrio straminisolvens JCM 21531]